MIGTKFYKGQFSDEEYASAANWCNEQQGATIEDMGDYYEVVAIPEAPLEVKKEHKIKELKNIRDEKELEPILYNENYFDFDQRSYERITAAIYALDIMGGTIGWTTADNDTVNVTANDLRGVIAQAANRSNSLHIHYRQKRALVDEATTSEELEAITW